MLEKALWFFHHYAFYDVFFEQRRRTTRHFNKVEKRYIGPRDPTPTHTPHNSHTPTLRLWITRSSHQGLKNDQKTFMPYAPKGSDITISSWSLEAPAKHQISPCVLIAVRTPWILGLLLSKTQVFWCFQIPQATNTIKELRPLRASLGQQQYYISSVNLLLKFLSYQNFGKKLKYIFSKITYDVLYNITKVDIKTQLTRGKTEITNHAKG